MKKYFLPLLAVLTMVSCKKLNELTVFDITMNSEVVIPNTVGINLPFSMNTFDIETNSSSTFENNDTRTDLIQEISLTSCDLTITSPSNGNFDFLKSIKIYISTSDLPEILIAQKTDIQDGQGNTLSLDVSGEDMTEYIKESKFDMRTDIVTDQVPGSEVHIDVESVFRVDAKILGI